MPGAFGPNGQRGSESPGHKSQDVVFDSQSALKYYPRDGAQAIHRLQHNRGKLVNATDSIRFVAGRTTKEKTPRGTVGGLVFADDTPINYEGLRQS